MAQDKSSGAQALLSDYLAGMTSLNLDRLVVRHSNPGFLDDTPEEFRGIDVTSTVLHTRSDGWSPTKAAFDAVLGIVTLKTGGVSGKAGESACTGLRNQADTLGDLVVEAAQKSSTARYMARVRLNPGLDFLSPVESVRRKTPFPSI